MSSREEAPTKSEESNALERHGENASDAETSVNERSCTEGENGGRENSRRSESMEDGQEYDGHEEEVPNSSARPKEDAENGSDKEGPPNDLPPRSHINDDENQIEVASENRPSQESAATQVAAAPPSSERAATHAHGQRIMPLAAAKVTRTSATSHVQPQARGTTNEGARSNRLPPIVHQGLLQQASNHPSTSGRTEPALQHHNNMGGPAQPALSSSLNEALIRELQALQQQAGAFSSGAAHTLPAGLAGALANPQASHSQFRTTSAQDRAYSELLRRLFATSSTSSSAISSAGSNRLRDLLSEALQNQSRDNTIAQLLGPQPSAQERAYSAEFLHQLTRSSSTSSAPPFVGNQVRDLMAQAVQTQNQENAIIAQLLGLQPSAQDRSHLELLHQLSAISSTNSVLPFAGNQVRDLLARAAPAQNQENAAIARLLGPQTWAHDRLHLEMQSLLSRSSSTNPTAPAASTQSQGLSQEHIIAQIWGLLTPNWNPHLPANNNSALPGTAPGTFEDLVRALSDRFNDHAPTNLNLSRAGDRSRLLQSLVNSINGQIGAPDSQVNPQVLQQQQRLAGVSEMLLQVSAANAPPAASPQAPLGASHLAAALQPLTANPVPAASAASLPAAAAAAGTAARGSAAGGLKSGGGSRSIDQVQFSFEATTYHEVRWRTRFQELLNFREEYGHCRVPHKFQENESLAWWVMNLRSQYKKYIQGKDSCLTEERVRLLDDIGFEWAPGSGKSPEKKGKKEGGSKKK